MAGGSKDEALVAFHGDIGGKIDGKLQLLEQAKPISDESLQKAANYGSRLYRGPYFLIARPGAFGSSGHHVKDRKTLLEIRIAMAALDALKRQNGFKRFHLVGHSGGGHTVAGLAQLRSDIGCAVIASAAISLRSMASDRIGRPLIGKHRFYDPIDHVHAMKQRPDLRLFVVSDRKDKFVSYRSQLEFVERVKAHNLPITHVTATATDKDSHGLFAHGLRLAVDCAKKARDQVPVASPAVASARSAQAVAPLISPPPPTSLANEPKKVTTLAVRQHSSGAEPAAMAFVVQVSAQKTEDDARAFYQVLQQKYSSVLGGRDPIIRRAELGQIGGWYRVQVGPFVTSEQATVLCNSLKAAGGLCIVQEDTPQPVSVEPRVRDRKEAEPEFAPPLRQRAEEGEDGHGPARRGLRRHGGAHSGREGRRWRLCGAGFGAEDRG